MFMLPKEKIDAYRTQLEEERKKLARTLIKEERPEDFGDDVDDFNEETDESTSFANRLSVGQSMRDRLNEIDAALNRMATGEYGLCVKCNGTISEKILSLVPESSLCESCKRGDRAQ